MGLETVRKKPQEGMGIPGGRGEISMVKQKSVQNQALKLPATSGPWKHLVTHVNLLPAEGDIGKDLGDVGNVGRKEKGCAYLDPFCGVLQCFAQDTMAVFNLSCFYALCIYSTSCL